MNGILTKNEITTALTELRETDRKLLSVDSTLNPEAYQLLVRSMEAGVEAKRLTELAIKKFEEAKAAGQLAMQSFVEMSEQATTAGSRGKDLSLRYSTARYLFESTDDIMTPKIFLVEHEPDADNILTMLRDMKKKLGL